MATSQDYANQLAKMKDMPNYQQGLAKLYDNPVLKPLTQEAADLESQYLPSLFKPFMEGGTSAADMSPAAKLAAIGGSLGRLGGQVSANNSIQNFYGNQIQQLAQNETQKWQMQQQKLKDMYSMAFQKEEADRAERARQEQMALQRASMARQQAQQQAAAFPGMQGGMSSSDPRAKQAQGILGQVKSLVSKGVKNVNDPRMNSYLMQLNQMGYDPYKLKSLGLDFTPISQQTGGQHSAYGGIGGAMGNYLGSLF